MPCRSGYEEVREIIREVYVTRDDYHKKVDAQHQNEVNRLTSELNHLRKEANSVIEERNKIVKELDDMTWAFCYITNRLFENDLNYLKLLLQNERVAKEFWEHQQLDMKAGRTFIYVDKNGEFQLFKCME